MTSQPTLRTYQQPAEPDTQQRIEDLFASQKPIFSFEFFPPRTPAGLIALQRTIGDLAALQPAFVSVTYGAGGSTRQMTRDVVSQIAREIGLTAMAHLTCTMHSQDELRTILKDLEQAGIVNVLALRGDPPQDRQEHATPGDAFAHASDLVHFIRNERFAFCLGGACYPEGHLDSEDREEDLANLKHKVDAGVSFLITQLFFDNAHYFDFVSKARAAGITVPIIPGIMPITDFAQIQRFTRLCGATIPTRLMLALERCDTPADVLATGVRWAAAQCRELLQRGAPGVHFYTLNKSPATNMVLSALS